uniref:Uncharacterized protein n=1 Tax=Marseillevirus LCMAC101 TaxID=2506602 RepID=A0A481YT44_9VIRU|nr:MAG: hypothetical protein LCMAC101_07550 [Marseillevirus LCMAC101]
MSGISREKAPVPRGAKAISILGVMTETGGTISRTSLGAQIKESTVTSKLTLSPSSQGGYFEEDTHLTAGFCGLSITKAINLQ